MMNYVVGVDGGGTKTAGLLVDLEGHVVAHRSVGPTNFQIVGADGIRREIPRLLGDLFTAAGMKQQQLAGIALGLAGVGRPGEPEKVASLVRELGVGQEVVVDHDAMIALVGALGDQPGVIIIAGTGSIVLGRNERGDRVRVGGWGYLLGDEGSGFYIARAALAAVMRAYDGRERETVLTEKLLQALGLTHPQEIIPRVYRRKMSHTEMADLTPVVFQSAREGDAVAREILDMAGRELGLMAATAIGRLGMTGQVKIGLVGSLFKSKDLLLRAVRATLGEDIEGDFVTPRLDAVGGAALLALKAAGVEATEEIVKRLQNRGAEDGVVKEMKKSLDNGSGF